ncbi:peptide-methionine (R)-S-oxide reductase MsrB [Pacificimonas pallii]
MSMTTKREFLRLGAGGVAALFAATSARAGNAARGDFPVSYSDAEWKKRLTDREYHVLRQARTERPGTSPLNAEKRRGVFTCAGCGNPVYSSLTKYDSGTGWPSFWAPIRKNSVGTSRDRGFFTVRTEVHCARCGGHLGHMFGDGPAPTGKRHCINGAALNFVHRPKKGA